MIYRILGNDLDNIAIFPIAKTETDCGEAINQQEIEFINALQGATNIRVQSTILQLVGINGILNFSAVPPTIITSTPTIITKVTEDLPHLLQTGRMVRVHPLGTIDGHVRNVVFLLVLMKLVGHEDLPDWLAVLRDQFNRGDWHES